MDLKTLVANAECLQPPLEDLCSLHSLKRPRIWDWTDLPLLLTITSRSWVEYFSLLSKVILLRSTL
jgi:hypothetical protein